MSEEQEDLNYVKAFKKIVKILFGTDKPPIVLRVILILLMVIHAIEFVLFSLVSAFVLLSPDRYYEKNVLEDFANLGDDFFYAFTLLQVIIFFILLVLWRMKTIGVYLYTIFSLVEIVIPYFLVDNTGFPWIVLLVNVVVIATLFYLVGRENRVEEIEGDIDEEDEEVELPF